VSFTRQPQTDGIRALGNDSGDRNNAGELGGQVWEKVEEREKQKQDRMFQLQAAKSSPAKGQVTGFQNCAKHSVIALHLLLSAF
jgi:hypothetical protein